MRRVRAVWFYRVSGGGHCLLAQGSAVRSRYLGGLWAVMVQCSAVEPIDLGPLDFLSGPVISRAATGNTYSFTGRAAHPLARLQITRVEIPASLAKDDLTSCATAFLFEIRKQAPDLYWERSPTALRVGPYPLALWRWNGTISSRMTTGIVSCGIVGERYLAVTFQDAIRHAPASFPTLRKHLENLDLP